MYSVMKEEESQEEEGTDGRRIVPSKSIVCPLKTYIKKEERRKWKRMRDGGVVRGLGFALRKRIYLHTLNSYRASGVCAWLSYILLVTVEYLNSEMREKKKYAIKCGKKETRLQKTNNCRTQTKRKV